MPVRRYEDDPWASTVSKRGLACDELISALQKYVRRSETEECLLIAREMYETSEELAHHLWERLVFIASADVNDGTFLAPVIVETLRAQCLRQPWAEQQGWLFVAQAVRYLCQSPKDMTTEDMCMWGHHVMTEGLRSPRIPEYAIDNHTRRGQLAGRGVKHFLEVGCQVTNEVPGRDTSYRARVLEFVDRHEWKE
ncbi:hypothetical protein [Actinoplanes sp. G11-F43]|uniref:hypothetical protein n=1 Tax=Actinoplanes sp. G11-F43 TaxID=3424130 RepID=UPI003D352101